jgi:hypothetical protein
LRRKAWITDKLQRIAELVLTAISPKQDRDGYHYLYDPDHTQRPPAGFGKFYKTPKGWSTNPKYQHGEFPYDMVKNLTESELKNVPLVKKQEKTNIAPVAETKRKLIEKLSFVSENEIDAIERLPDSLFAPVKPETVECSKAKSNAIAYEIGDGTGNVKTKYDIHLNPDDVNEYASSKSTVHEIAHLSLLSSPLRHDPEFLSNTTISLASEFMKFSSDFKARIKKISKGDDAKVNQDFDSIFKFKGRGDRYPKRLDNVSKALMGKQFKLLTEKEASDLGSFMDCVMCATEGEYGFGHNKNYMKEKGSNNNVHEFWAHVGEDYFSANPLIRRYFNNSISFIRKTMEGMK